LPDARRRSDEGAVPQHLAEKAVVAVCRFAVTESNHRDRRDRRGEATGRPAKPAACATERAAHTQALLSSIACLGAALLGCAPAERAGSLRCRSRRPLCVLRVLCG